MLLEKCTDEFKKIYSRYLKSKKHNLKKTFNLEKLFDEKNKHEINKQDEEELFQEEAVKDFDNKLGGMNDNLAIHNQLKHKQDPKKKKIQKKNLLEFFEDKNLNINNINDNIEMNYMIANVSPIGKLQFRLPHIETKFNLKIKPNIKLNIDKGKNNIMRINNLIDENHFIKEKLSIKISNIKNKQNKINSNLNNYSYNHINTSSTRNNTEHSSDPIQHFYALSHRVNEQKTLEKAASKNEVEKFIRVIEKQNKLKHFVDDIELFEYKILKEKENSEKIIEKGEIRRNNLKNKIKRVVETKFIY